MKVKVYFFKGKPDPSEMEEAVAIERWMLNNLYDLVWEAEFKNLVTPAVIASVLRTEPTPFGISFKEKQSRVVSVGDLIQVGPTLYLVLPRGFKELEIRKV